MTRFIKIDPEECQDAVVSLSPIILKLEDLYRVVRDFLYSQGLDLINKDLAQKQKGQLIIGRNANSLFQSEGVYCEILQPGWSGWKKGKLRIKAYIEFEPDEPEGDETALDSGNSQGTEIEFPLDEVRKGISDLS